MYGEDKGPTPAQIAEQKAWDEWNDRYIDDPVLFVQEVLGADPWPWQKEVLRAYGRGERRLTLRSGHRVGKTACLSWVAIHHQLLRFPQKTIVMASTEKQLFNVLMPEIKNWIQVMPEKVQELLIVGAEYIRLKRAPSASFLSAVAVRAENPESIAGAHSGGAFGEGSVLIIVDEASGPPDIVFESLAGSMAGPKACTILAGNPIRRTGFFHMTHTRLARHPGLDDTAGSWLTFHVSSKNNPNVSPDLAADIAKRYGEHSNAYRVRVLGEFPISEDDTIIPYDLVMLATQREDVRQVEGPMIWGVDPASSGDDRTCLVKRRMNIVAEPPLFWYKLDEMAIVGRIKEQWDNTKEKERPVAIFVDSIIWGAGVASRLKELGLPAVGIRVSELPSMRGEKKYKNLRTENWFRMREFFDARDCRIPYDEEFVEELSSQPYKIIESNGMALANPKKEVKQVLGRSPDAADAMMLTFCRNAGFTSGQQADWNKPIKRNIRGIV